MDEKRVGQIALAVLKAKMVKEGLTLSGSTLRDLGSLAQRTGIPKEELHEFMMAILPEIIGAALGYEQVSLTTGGRVTERRQEQD